MTSDLFIFQHSDSSFSHYGSDHRVPHGNDLDNIDYSTLSLGEQTPLLSPDVPETPSVAVCQCCLNPFFSYVFRMAPVVKPYRQTHPAEAARPR